MKTPEDFRAEAEHLFTHVDALAEWIASQNLAGGDGAAVAASYAGKYVGEAATSPADLEQGLQIICRILIIAGKRAYEGRDGKEH